MSTVVLMPAYQPDATLIELTRSLSSLGFRVLVVNDGSASDCDEIFGRVKEFAVVTGYEKNRGKGMALKHGIKYIKENMPDCTGFITADADGQHTPEDITRVKNALDDGALFVLGIRKFEGRVPFKSRIGNDMSRAAYAIASGKYLSDNQCGLRGFSAKLADWLLSIGGKRYEYEINVLMRAALENVKITELDVKTVYISGNKSTHFRPLEDTVLIHKRIWMAAWITLAVVITSIALVIAIEEIAKYYGIDVQAWLWGSGGISMVLGSILFVTFVPLAGFALLKSVLNFFVRGSAGFVVTLILTSILSYFSKMPLALSYVISGGVAVVLKYYALKGAHLLRGSLKKRPAEITDEKV